MWGLTRELARVSVGDNQVARWTGTPIRQEFTNPSCVRPSLAFALRRGEGSTGPLGFRVFMANQKLPDFLQAAIESCGFCGERRAECDLCVATWPGKAQGVEPDHWQAHSADAIKAATRIAFYGSGYVPTPKMMRSFLDALYGQSPRCAACYDTGFAHTHEGDFIGGCDVCNPESRCLNYREYGLVCAKKYGHSGPCLSDTTLE